MRLKRGEERGKENVGARGGVCGRLIAERERRGGTVGEEGTDRRTRPVSGRERERGGGGGRLGQAQREKGAQGRCNIRFQEQNQICTICEF